MVFLRVAACIRGMTCRVSRVAMSLTPSSERSSERGVISDFPMDMGFGKMKVGAGIVTHSCCPPGHVASLHCGIRGPKATLGGALAASVDSAPTTTGLPPAA